MLTKLTVRNFKTLKEAVVPLGQNVVLIGPNNSGKTTALQALALWQWRRREIENYLCSREILMRYAEGMEPDDLISLAEKSVRTDAMRYAVDRVEAALQELGHDPWSPDFKVSDDFLPTVFKRYFERLGTDDRLAKSDFHVLTELVGKHDVDQEVVEALDLICSQAAKARPVGN